MPTQAQDKEQRNEIQINEQRYLIDKDGIVYDINTDEIIGVMI